MIDGISFGCSAILKRGFRIASSLILVYHLSLRVGIDQEYRMGRANFGELATIG